MPPDTDDSNLLQHLMRAILDHMKAKNGESELPEEKPMTPEKTTPAPTGGGSGAPVDPRFCS